MKPNIKPSPDPLHIKRAYYKRLELLQYVKSGWSMERTAKHHGLTMEELEEALKEPVE